MDRQIRNINSVASGLLNSSIKSLNDRNTRNISPRERIEQGMKQMGKSFRIAGSRISGGDSSKNVRDSSKNSSKNSSENSPRVQQLGNKDRRPSLSASMNLLSIVRKTNSINVNNTRTTSQILLTEKKLSVRHSSSLVSDFDPAADLIQDGQNSVLKAAGNLLEEVSNDDNHHHHNNDLPVISKLSGQDPEPPKIEDTKIPDSTTSHPTNLLVSAGTSPSSRPTKTPAGDPNDDPTKIWDYHFLIVDDTPSNRRMLQMVLNKRNIHCDVAENGKEAVDIVRDRGDRYDFIFMVPCKPLEYCQLTYVN